MHISTSSSNAGSRLVKTENSSVRNKQNIVKVWHTIIESSKRQMPMYHTELESDLLYYLIILIVWFICRDICMNLWLFLEMTVSNLWIIISINTLNMQIGQQWLRFVHSHREWLFKSPSRVVAVFSAVLRQRSCMRNLAFGPFSFYFPWGTPP